MKTKIWQDQDSRQCISRQSWHKTRHTRIKTQHRTYQEEDNLDSRQDIPDAGFKPRHTKKKGKPRYNTTKNE